VVADTNAWLNAFLNPDLVVGRRLHLRRSARFVLVFSRELQDRIVRFLGTKPYFTARVSPATLADDAAWLATAETLGAEDAQVARQLSGAAGGVSDVARAAGCAAAGRTARDGEAGRNGGG